MSIVIYYFLGPFIRNDDPKFAFSFSSRKTTTMATQSEQPVHYLYREKTHPCFLWTLALAPCLMPTVWYVNSLERENEP